MADRTSAKIFGNLFDILAKNPDINSNQLAKILWEMQRGYDFSPYQMNADEALVKLGFAKEVPDSEDPEYTVTLYKNGNGFE